MCPMICTPVKTWDAHSSIQMLWCVEWAENSCLHRLKTLKKMCCLSRLEAELGFTEEEHQRVVFSWRTDWIVNFALVGCLSRDGVKKPVAWSNVAEKHLDEADNNVKVSWADCRSWKIIDCHTFLSATSFWSMSFPSFFNVNWILSDGTGSDFMAWSN